MPARRVIRPDAPGPFSPGLVVDGWVYLAGQGGFDPETGELGPDVATQTAQTIENVATLLEEAGCTGPEVLGHCRGPGPHVRGCWAVDHILAGGR